MKDLSAVQQTVQQMPDLKAGYLLVMSGGAGSFAQAVTEWGSLLVTMGNGLLVFGGLYLMYLKIKTTRSAEKGGRRDGDKVS